MSLEIRKGVADVRIENMGLIPKIDEALMKLGAGEYFELPFGKDQLARDRVKLVKGKAKFRITQNKGDQVTRCYRVE
jgi:hypothetical protein